MLLDPSLTAAVGVLSLAVALARVPVAWTLGRTAGRALGRVLALAWRRWLESWDDV